jgi:S-formylglutathione hydrolase
MRDALPDAGWSRETIGATPVYVTAAGEDPVGTIVILPDFGWPILDGPAGGDALAALRDCLRAARLGAILPDVRSWWINRPDPLIADFATPLEFVTGALVPWIESRSPAGVRLAVFGVGIGGQGAFQLAYRFPQLFPVVAAVSPAIDFHRLHPGAPQLQAWFETAERARQETATLRLHPLNWPPHQWFSCPRDDWRFDGCERLASKLGSSGIPFTADFNPAGGQTEQIGQAIEFIAARLKEPLATREIRIGR